MNPIDPREAAWASEMRAMAALMSATTMLGFERQIIAPVANPFALRWVPAGSMVGGTKIGETRPVTGQQDVVHIGDGSLHPGDSNAADLRPAWHHVTIDQIGEVFFDPTTQDVPSADVSQSLGNTATLLKARVTIAVGNARKQVFDFDILAGVDFSLAGLHVLSVEALVPDPTSIISSPPDVPVLSLATTVCTGVYCGLAPRGTRLPQTYSQVFYLSEELMAFMPVVPGAREVEIFSDMPAAAANSILADFLYVLENPLEAQASNTYAPAAFVVGSVNVPVGSYSSARVAIPGNANMIRVTTSGLTNPTINIVQFLKF